MSCHLHPTRLVCGSDLGTPESRITVAMAGFFLPSNPSFTTLNFANKTSSPMTARKTRWGTTFSPYEEIGEPVRPACHFDIAAHLSAHAFEPEISENEDEDLNISPHIDADVIPPISPSTLTSLHVDIAPPVTSSTSTSQHSSGLFVESHNGSVATKKKKLKQRFKERRRNKRHQEQESAKMSLKAVSLRRARASKLEAINPDINIADAPVASTAWVGLRDKQDEATYGVDVLVGPKYSMTYVNWDGR